MNEQEKEQAIQFYLSNELKDSNGIYKLDWNGIKLWTKGEHLYAERCKSLLKAALEAE